MLWHAIGDQITSQTCYITFLISLINAKMSSMCKGNCLCIIYAVWCLCIDLCYVLKPGLDMEGSDLYSPCMLFPLEYDRNVFLFIKWWTWMPWESCRNMSIQGSFWFALHGATQPNRWLTELSYTDALLLPVSLQGFSWTWEPVWICLSRPQQPEIVTKFRHNVPHEDREYMRCLIIRHVNACRGRERQGGS